MKLNIQMIRDSFEIAKPNAETVAEMFYDNLFTDYPEAKPLFKDVDLTKQRKALVGSLVTVVDNLDKPEQLEKYLHGLGSRHVNYNVEIPHYELVGKTLLKTFAQAFGEKWVPELEAEWAKAYGVIRDVMIEGAQKTANPTDSIFSNEIRSLIKHHAKETVADMIRQEINRAIAEEIKAISADLISEMIKKAG